MVKIKKTFYIFLFTILGIIFSFLVHGLIEIPVINLLTKDFDRYYLGLSWSQWYLVHYIGSVVLFVLGAVFGYVQGKYWWRAIYVEKKYFKKRKK